MRTILVSYVSRRHTGGLGLLTEWTLTSIDTVKRVTDPNDPNDWSVLHRSGNCALVVQNAVATRVGNQDVVNLLDSIKDDANDEGNIEEKGGISECSGDIGVSYWLRDTNGL